jgi:uncharacterized protein (TIRG00374 family)
LGRDNHHIKISAFDDDASAVTLRTGWTPRILGTLLALAAAWFVVVHADGLLPAIAQVAGLGPAALPIGLAIVAVGVLNRALQAHVSFRLVELPARFGAMVHLSATSYATNKVVKSAGTAGLVPYLAHADRVGQNRAQVVAAYLAAKLAETMSLCCMIGFAVVAGAATGGLHGTALWGAVASAVYALVVGTALILIAGRRSLVQAIANRARRFAFHLRNRFGRPHPVPGACAGHELSCAMDRMRADPRAAVPLLGTAFAGKLLGCAGLFMVLTGLGIHLGLATTLLVYTLTLMVALVGPLPGGIGIADASLGALLVANGVSGPSAAAAVVAFRLLDLWLPLLVGAATGARQYQRNRAAATDAADVEPPAPVAVLVPVTAGASN